MTPHPSPDRWVSVNDACAELGVSRATLYRCLDAGLVDLAVRVPGRGARGRLRIPVRAAIDWLKARSQA